MLVLNIFCMKHHQFCFFKCVVFIRNQLLIEFMQYYLDVELCYNSNYNKFVPSVYNFELGDIASIRMLFMYIMLYAL